MGSSVSKGAVPRTIEFKPRFAGLPRIGLAANGT